MTENLQKQLSDFATKNEKYKKFGTKNMSPNSAALETNFVHSVHFWNETAASLVLIAKKMVTW